jgi:hypothetical protein
MAAWLYTLLEHASLMGVFQLFSTLSTTDIVVVFLASKPVFVLSAMFTGAHAKLTAAD